MAKKKKHLKKKPKLKGKKPALRSETKKGIVAIVCFALTVLSFLSFFGRAGLFGQYFVQGGQRLFGRALFLVPLTFLFLGEKLLKALKPKKIESQEQMANQPDKRRAETLGDSLIANQADKQDAETLGDSLTTGKVVQFKATDFKLPPLDFLEKDKGQPTSGDIKANINIIKRTLENFNIEVEMAEVSIGPTVT